jgi:hypothetical protein
MTTPCLHRRAFILHVDLDPVPGTFHTPLSANEIVQAILNNYLPSYTPVAIFGVAHPDEQKDNWRKRVCFVIFIDLFANLLVDPNRINPQHEMLNTLRHIFSEAIGHYNPALSLAPASIQPKNIVGGVV